MIEVGFRRVYRQGEGVSLILEDGTSIGQGKIERVLANGEAYVVEFNKTLILTPSACFESPGALRIGKSLYSWLVSQKITVQHPFLGASSVTH